MKKQSLSEINFDLWMSIGRTHHSIMLARQRELRKYNIPMRQLHVLRAIQDLGSESTLPEVARQVERAHHAISKQSARMERDGLIRRMKNTPKSNLLKLELTDKGLDIVKLARKSETIDLIFSVLSKQQRQQLISMLQEITIKATKLNSPKY